MLYDPLVIVAVDRPAQMQHGATWCPVRSSDKLCCRRFCDMRSLGVSWDDALKKTCVSGEAVLSTFLKAVVSRL